jgi:hypothetical protein
VSSTNRGAERLPDDAYMTPPWCVRRLLDVWRPRGTSGILVEPAVGTGNIVRTIGTEPFAWLTYDVREVAPVGEMHVTGDFLKVGSYGTDAEAVITNPPYSLAEEFIRHSRCCFPRADLVFLLRLNFLGAIERVPLWLALGTPDVNVLPNRPDFSGGGGDSCEYAWYVWPPEKRASGTVRVLAETSLAERKRDEVERAGQVRLPGMFVESAEGEFWKANEPKREGTTP